jgi:hypothetical protein
MNVGPCVSSAQQGQPHFGVAHRSPRHTHVTSKRRPKPKQFQEELVDPTTICFKNIPNGYSRQMVVELIDSCGFKDGYDFIYVPHSIRRLPRLVNLGYFFVNFVSHENAVRALERFAGFTEWVMSSDKIMVTTWAARTQGQKACIELAHSSRVGQKACIERFECGPTALNDGVVVPSSPPKEKLCPPPKTKTVVDKPSEDDREFFAGIGRADQKCRAGARDVISKEEASAKEELRSYGGDEVAVQEPSSKEQRPGLPTNQRVTLLGGDLTPMYVPMPSFGLPRCTSLDLCDGQYDLSVMPKLAERTVPPPPGLTPLTTLLIRNLPKSYDRDMLTELLDSKGFVSSYNFLYLPIDFKKRWALGYAMVDFVSHAEALRAIETLTTFSDWKAYPLPHSAGDVAFSTDAKQGLEANVQYYRNREMMHPDVPEMYKPLLLRCGARVAFPAPTQEIKLPKHVHKHVLQLPQASQQARK